MNGKIKVIVIIAAFFAVSTTWAQQTQSPPLQPTAQLSSSAPVAASADARPDSVTYEAIIASSSGRVEETLRSQQDLYWGIATTVGALLFGLIAFLGYGQIKSMREGLSEDVIRQLSNSATFKDTIANQIEDSVLRTLRDAQTAIEQQIDFLNVRSIAEGLENAQSFSATQRDSLFEGILRLKDVPSITGRPEFLAALEQAFSSFFQAGVWDKIDALEKELRSTTIANPTLVQSLVPSLGYRILSESLVSDDTHASLLRYVQAAKELKFPEVGYPFELAYLLHIKPVDWQRRIEIAFDDAESMTDNDLRVFLERIEHLSDPSKIANSPRAYHERIAAKFAAVRSIYASRLNRLTAILESRSNAGIEDR